MAQTIIGRVQPLFKGQYSNSVEYELNDVVTYNGSTYWHWTAEKTLDVPPTDETAWGKIVDASGAEPFVARAETAASNAENFSDSAEEYMTAAGEYAQTATEAKESAVESASQASESASQADTAQTASEAAMTSSVAAAEASANARDLAVAAKDDAVEAKTAAETAMTAAQTSETNAAEYNRLSAINAEAAQSALAGMNYVSFIMDENGHLLIQNAERLGTTSFRIQNGKLEVQI